EPVDLNTAEQEDLERLPGIGEELARRILAYREETGGFTSLEELMNVSGIGEKKFAALDGYITVNGGDEP
ncbi:MAG: helix-hairpin-helix domain-containing protein, partial [Oscillibacter sp.]|nr:helix-hairpin-helix domain-containing protein [Oscillibacter sp.]